MSDIKDFIAKQNINYRTGNQELSDDVYDSLLDQIDDIELKTKVGFDIKGTKHKLPINMGSLNKIKTESELSDWKNSKIKANVDVVITPKYDGLAICLQIKDGWISAYTRGDGYEGQDITTHLPNNFVTKLHNYTESYKKSDIILVGEIIMNKSVFNTKYSSVYKNPRNMTAGILNKKTKEEPCNDLTVILYGIKHSDEEFKSKTSMLRYLNVNLNIFAVDFINHKLDDITKDTNILSDFRKNTTDYETDGVVITIDDQQICENIGYETNSLNPSFSRAWKPQGLDFVAAYVTGIDWSTSKNGRVVPTALLSPVDIDGSTISRVTGYNAKFIMDMEIQAGVVVKLIKAGSIIPKITGIVQGTDDFRGVISKCPTCYSKVEFNDTKIDLICKNPLCEAQNFKSVLTFFKTLDINDIGEGVLKTFFSEGYSSVESILQLTEFDISGFEGFGTRKASKIYNSIHSKLSDIPLHELQAASNLFEGLGSTKLKKLIQYDSKAKKPTIEQVKKIEGFSDKTAEVFVEAFDEFWDWVAPLPITIKVESASFDGFLSGEKIIFTGFRDDEMEATVKENGGEIINSVSKKTTILVTNKKGSGSSKEIKAEELGVVIMDKEEFKKFIKANVGLGALEL